MKNKIRALSAVILSLCCLAAIFSSCGKPTEDTESTTIATTTAVRVPTDGYTYFSNAAQIQPSNEGAENDSGYSYAQSNAATEYVPITIKQPETTNRVKTTAAQTQRATAAVTTSKSSGSNEDVDEIISGISILAKSENVKIRNSATIMIQGTPGARYTIEFYENSTRKASYDELSAKTADSSGIVSWTFLVPDSCEPGARRLIIRETNSDNYIQTSININ